MADLNRPRPEELATVQALKDLEFEYGVDSWGWGYHHLSDEALALVPKLTTIKYLDLFESCDGSETTDAGLAHLAGNTSLVCLRIGPGITDAGLAHLAGLTQLTELRIDSADGVTDTGMASVGRLTKLENLSIQFTGVGDAGIEALHALTQLRNLEIAATKVTDAAIPRLIQFRKLTSLSVTGSGITPESVELLKAALQLCQVG